MWSTPERLRGEVLTTRRYTNRPPLPFYLSAKKILYVRVEEQSWWDAAVLTARPHHSAVNTTHLIIRLAKGATVIRTDATGRRWRHRWVTWSPRSPCSSPSSPVTCCKHLTLMQLITMLKMTIQVRYRKSPRDTRRTVKLKLTLTLVLTITDTGSAVLTLMLGYRSLYIAWQ